MANVKNKSSSKTTRPDRLPELTASHSVMEGGAKARERARANDAKFRAKKKASAIEAQIKTWASVLLLPAERRAFMAAADMASGTHAELLTRMGAAIIRQAVRTTEAFARELTLDNPDPNKLAHLGATRSAWHESGTLCARMLASVTAAEKQAWVRGKVDQLRAVEVMLAGALGAMERPASHAPPPPPGAVLGNEDGAPGVH